VSNPLRYDAHVIAAAPQGRQTLADYVRAAEAGGLQCLGLALPAPYNLADLPARLAAIQRAGDHSPVRVLPVADVDIIAVDGSLDITEHTASRFALVMASLGGKCPGVDIEVPARREQFFDNLFAAYFNVVANRLADVLARPFNLGRFPAPVTPSELPREPLQRLATLMFEQEVAFELFASIHAAFAFLSVEQFTREYAALLKIFRVAGVKFVVGSGADLPQGVGNTRYCRRLMEAAGIELSQLVDLARIA